VRLSPGTIRRQLAGRGALHTEVQNLLAVGVLEVLLDHDVSLAVARDRLSGGALELFEETSRSWKRGQTGWGSDDSDCEREVVPGRTRSRPALGLDEPGNWRRHPVG